MNPLSSENLPGEKRMSAAALERYAAEAEAAALRMTGRTFAELLKQEADVETQTAPSKAA
jgi:hypothetical protein